MNNNGAGFQVTFTKFMTEDNIQGLSKLDMSKELCNRYATFTELWTPFPSGTLNYDDVCLLGFFSFLTGPAVPAGLPPMRSANDIDVPSSSSSMNSTSFISPFSFLACKCEFRNVGLWICDRTTARIRQWNPLIRQFMLWAGMHLFQGWYTLHIIRNSRTFPRPFRDVSCSFVQWQWQVHM